MTFMEWLQDTADYNVIDRVYSKGGRPYLVKQEGKQNECKEHALFLLRQAKHQLTTQACATVFDSSILDLEDINSPQLQVLVNKAREDTCNNDTGTLVRQKQDMCNTQEAGQQETRDTGNDDKNIHPTTRVVNVPVHTEADTGTRVGQRGLNMVTPMKPSEQVRQVVGTGRGRGRGSNMLGFRLAADMLSQANRHERVITTGKPPFEQDKFYKQQKA